MIRHFSAQLKHKVSNVVVIEQLLALVRHYRVDCDALATPGCFYKDRSLDVLTKGDGFSQVVSKRRGGVAGRGSGQYRPGRGKTQRMITTLCEPSSVLVLLL